MADLEVLSHALQFVNPVGCLMVVMDPLEPRQELQHHIIDTDAADGIPDVSGPDRLSLHVWMVALIRDEAPHCALEHLPLHGIESAVLAIAIIVEGWPALIEQMNSHHIKHFLQGQCFFLRPS